MPLDCRLAARLQKAPSQKRGQDALLPTDRYRPLLLRIWSSTAVLSPRRPSNRADGQPWENRRTTHGRPFAPEAL